MLLNMKKQHFSQETALGQIKLRHLYGELNPHISLPKLVLSQSHSGGFSHHLTFPIDSYFILFLAS